MSTLTYRQSFPAQSGRHTRAAAALAVAVGIALGVAFASTEATPTATNDPSAVESITVEPTGAQLAPNTESQSPLGMGGNLGPIHPD